MTENDEGSDYEDDFKLDTSIPMDNDGIIINYDHHAKLNIPTRSKLITDPIKVDGKPLAFLPISVHERNEYQNGIKTYVLSLMGHLEDGSKALLTFKGIDIYFVADTDNILNIKRILAKEGITPLSIQPIEGFPFKGYQRTKSKMLKIIFSSLDNYKKAVVAIHNAQIVCYFNDISCYYRKVFREHNISVNTWGIILAYTYKEQDELKYPRCHYQISATISMYKNFDSKIFNDTQRKALEERMSKPNYINPKTLIVGWDIEAYSERRMGDVPMPEHPEDNCFMIALSAYWGYDPKPILQICILDVSTLSTKNWITIICKSKKDVVLAFFKCLSYLIPDILTGFNDAGYDWPFIVGKLAQWKIALEVFTMTSAFAPYSNSTNETILKYQYKHSELKLDASRKLELNFLSIPGIVMLDVCAILRRLKSKEESIKYSLKYFLEMFKLEAKVDMPINVMWNYYRNANDSIESRKNMHYVAYYCVNDADRCQQLLTNQKIIANYRETAEISKISFEDMYLYAGGIRVRNLICNKAIESNIYVPMYSPFVLKSDGKAKDKYPGAYVVPPKKGIVPNPQIHQELDDAIASKDPERIKAAFDAFKEERPYAGLDFASLYPSIIMAFNYSPDRIVLDETKLHELFTEEEINNPFIIYPISFQYQNKEVKAWSVRHQGKESEKGIYVKILEFLINYRGRLKVDQQVADEELEIMGLIKIHKHLSIVEAIDIVSNTITNADLIKRMPLIRPTLEVMTWDQFNDYYQKTKNLSGYCKTKQEAVKVYMNTFYGETGNTSSPICLIASAGAVTSTGANNLKMVKLFVESKGFVVRYGDTDSLYLCPPASYFTECDDKYAKGEYTKLQFWTAMVKQTMIAMSDIKSEVNSMLEKKTGTKYLNMSYEEVLYPAAFFGKKNYAGIMHIKEVNFQYVRDNDKRVLIKGLTAFKRGQTALSYEISHLILESILSINNTRSIYDNVEHIIKECYKRTDWDNKYFIRSQLYRPDKQNVSVLTFIERMKIKNDEINRVNAENIKNGLPIIPNIYELPQKGERFNFYVTKGNLQFYDYKGTKLDHKISDKMEFTRVVDTLGLEIDKSYYFKGAIAKSGARFISEYYEDLSITDYKERDKKAIDKAVRVIQKFIDMDAKLDPAEGRELRKKYKHALTYLSDDAINLIQFPVKNNEITINPNRTLEIIIKHVYSMTQSFDLIPLFTIYQELGKKPENPASSFMKRQAFDVQESQIKNTIFRMLPEIAKTSIKIEESLKNIVMNLDLYIEDEDDEIELIEPEDQELYDKFIKLFWILSGIYLMKRVIIEYGNWLKDKKSIDFNYIREPTREYKHEVIENAINVLLN